MYDEDTTAEELISDPSLAIRWNGRDYEVKTQQDETLQLIQIDGSRSATLSYSRVTNLLQSADDPFNTI